MLANQSQSWILRLNIQHQFHGKTYKSQAQHQTRTLNELPIEIRTSIKSNSLVFGLFSFVKNTDSVYEFKLQTISTFHDNLVCSSNSGNILSFSTDAAAFLYKKKPRHQRIASEECSYFSRQ